VLRDLQLTHLPSCAFAQPHLTSLQSMATTDTFYLALVHTQEELATILTSIFDPAGRRVLQHDMQDEDRLLHAVPARRWPFGIICRNQATALMRSWEVRWSFTTILMCTLFSPSRPA
jgi:hypothetical protein